jgi:hypothetical protein
MPDELESLNESAIAAWEAGQLEDAGEKLREAVDLARRLCHA